MSSSIEEAACTPVPVNPSLYNPKGKLPYGLTNEHIQLTMKEFVEFLGFINKQLYTKRIPRLESFLMPANFSSIVGEFIIITIPRFCSSLAKNQYHNGHPDLIPKR